MPGSVFGSVVRRVEDPRFLTGRARYVENVPVPNALRAVFVRSIMPHARIEDVDAAAATAMPGVRAVLARDVVRFVGEPLAVVLADDLARAMDAAESVAVAYDPLPSVVGAEAALA